MKDTIVKKLASLLMMAFMLWPGTSPLLSGAAADTGAIPDEDGYRLWLRAPQNANATVRANRQGATIDVAIKELKAAWQGGEVTLELAATPEAQALGKEGYAIKGDAAGVTISAPAEAGLLYGAYHLLRLQETRALDYPLALSEKPSYNVRVLNHWTGFAYEPPAGASQPTAAQAAIMARMSFWQPDLLPVIPAFYEQYARANASVGINATVIQLSGAPVLTAKWLQKVKQVADFMRPYNIRIYLGIDFATPQMLGELKTGDPLDPQVIKWWKDKCNEIYALIPDFGGFLMKANSEGTSGPRDYGRTHLDGANMIAAALRPHGGIIMWRAFVYDPTPTDRAKQAYNEFKPKDGEFLDNVIIQVKNGPVDFQPREPVSPLFGAMKKTPLMIEFQIMQEYFGGSNHIAYLGPLYEETLDTDTYQEGPGSTVAHVTDGTTFKNQKITAMAGVANIVSSTGAWTGSDFTQANWYVFGRLAWNNQLSAEAIAEEWVRQTFTNNPAFVTPVVDLMMRSREAEVDYMMPMGLHHLFAFGHHYGPEPWAEPSFARIDWLPRYYHKADAVGLGFDRTATGSNAVEQYARQLRELYANIDTCPEEFILWFHHVPWTRVMRSGRTLWEELCVHYDKGLREVREFQKIWDRVAPYIDKQRAQAVRDKLILQVNDAIWWRDACVQYFQTFAQQPIPYNLERPTQSLEVLKLIDLVDRSYPEKADYMKERPKVIPKIIGAGN